mgnify:CR=1 FL=1
MPRATLPQLLAARRIAVLGVTGAGKSTAARLLAETLGGTVIDADNDIRWADAAERGPWAIHAETEQRALAERLTAEAPWVIAAIPDVVDDVVRPRLDLTITLDYPPALTLARLLRRTARRIVTAEPVCNGNRETLAEALGQDSILRWWAQTVREKHASALAREAAADGVPELRLTDPRQLDRVLEALRA